MKIRYRGVIHIACNKKRWLSKGRLYTWCDMIFDNSFFPGGSKYVPESELIESKDPECETCIENINKRA